jgi:hypothetical protein
LGGVNKSFKTKKNNGGDETGKYSNQCMWISLIDFLNNVLGNNLSLDEIREIASIRGTRINDARNVFDTDLHMEALLNVTRLFDLQIHVYISFRDKTGALVIQDEPNMTIGDFSSRNVVSIVSYGRHFELITSIGHRNLFKCLCEVQTDFEPNQELAKGQEFKATLTPEQIQKIDKLLDDLSNLDRVIININQDIQKKQKEISDLELSFDSEKEKFINEDIETQTTLVSSFQDYIEFLKKEIDELGKKLKTFKSHQDTLQKILSEYLKS